MQSEPTSLVHAGPSGSSRSRAVAVSHCVYSVLDATIAWTPSYRIAPETVSDCDDLVVDFGLLQVIWYSQHNTVCCMRTFVHYPLLFNVHSTRGESNFLGPHPRNFYTVEVSRLVEVSLDTCRLRVRLTWTEEAQCYFLPVEMLGTYLAVRFYGRLLGTPISRCLIWHWVPEPTSTSWGRIAIIGCRADFS